MMRAAAWLIETWAMPSLVVADVIALLYVIANQPVMTIAYRVAMVVCATAAAVLLVLDPHRWWTLATDDILPFLFVFAAIAPALRRIAATPSSRPDHGAPTAQELVGPATMATNSDSAPSPAAQLWLVASAGLAAPGAALPVLEIVRGCASLFGVAPSSFARLHDTLVAVAYDSLLFTILSPVAALMGKEAFAPERRWLVWMLPVLALIGSLSFWLKLLILGSF